MTSDEELAGAFIAFVHAQPDHPAVIKLVAALEEYHAAREAMADG